VADIIKAGLSCRWRSSSWTDPASVREAFAKAGYPDCEALLIIEVEGSAG
jgi:glycolate oxidase